MVETDVNVLRTSWERCYHEAKRPRECVFCGAGRVWWNGRRRRSGTGVVAGRPVTVSRFSCRRVRCAACRRSWTLLPPGMFPRRHFHLDVGVRALSHYLFETAASLASAARAWLLSPRTLQRFRDWTAGLAAPATLQSLLARTAGAPLLARVLEVARTVRDRARRAVLCRAAEVLCLAEALAAAAGLGSPGLAVLAPRAALGQGPPPLPADAWRRAVQPGGA